MHPVVKGGVHFGMGRGAFSGEGCINHLGLA